MPMARRYYLNSALCLCVLVIVAIFIVPTMYRMMLFLGGILGLLLIGLGYYRSYQKALMQIKMYDSDEDYWAEIEYIHSVNQKGYDYFVFDSYAIYACYMLGEFTAYEKLAQKMSLSKQWKRPRFQTFRDKVKENLFCIAFLRKWAQNGVLDYQGINVLIIQSIQDYQNHNQSAILTRIENYPEQPPIKRACLFCLGKKFEWLDELYQSEEAKAIFEQIKGREING